MKKLVTIVSAVMMLLMLAACAPSANYTAEQYEEFTNGTLALTQIKAAAQEVFTEKYNDAKADENMKLGSSFVYTFEEATKVADTYTVAAGTKVEYKIATDTAGNCTSSTLSDVVSVDGSVSWKVGTDTEETTFAVEYYNATTEDLYNVGFSVNGTDYSDLLAAAKV